VEQQPTPAPPPSPTATPQSVPPEPPTPMAPPAEAMPPPPPGLPATPGEEGVHARGYEPRPLSGLGVALTAGGGVGGFFNSGARDAASDGFTWDVRLTLGTRIPVGLDLAYVGSVQGMNLPGLDSDALLVGNGAEAALRIQLPHGMVRPYLTGGVGWTHYSVQDTTLVAGLRPSDTIGTVPVGVGVAVGKVNGFTLDVRAVGRIAFDDDLLDNVTPNGGSNSLNSWGFTARLGGEF
jgi:hypothetical protein